MDIKEIFESYCGKMTQIHLYQRVIKKIAQKELEELHRYEERIASNPDYKKHSSSWNNMFFAEADTGEQFFYGFKESSIEDRMLSTVLHQNKQYQWLLAEAYEEFEDFLENVYAFSGFIDKNFWPLCDYGNITFNELSNKPFEWFQRQAANKKNLPSSIINKYREEFQSIKIVEKSNKFEVNLYLAIVLIEFFRHIIVHKGGVVSDKEEFIKKVLSKAGLLNNNKPSEENLSFIKNFFGKVPYDNTIILLEIKTHPEIPLDTHINVFNTVSDYLMTYAHMIFKAVEQTHNKSLKSQAEPAGTPTA